MLKVSQFLPEKHVRFRYICGQDRQTSDVTSSDMLVNGRRVQVSEI